MNLSLRFATILLTGMVCTSTFAGDVVTINVSGTLTQTPCILTSSKTLSANFGRILSDQINNVSPIDIPITLYCPANSSLNVSIKASGVYPISPPTMATTTKANLIYMFTWKSNGTLAYVDGTQRKLTNLSGNVNLGLTARLAALSAQTEGIFTGTSVITLEYL